MRELGMIEDVGAAFPDEAAALAYFTKIRWHDGPSCPFCRSARIYNFSDGRTHKCGECRRRFSIKVGTIFEDSKIEIRKWLIAIWLITNEKEGTASTVLAKRLGVSQKTAWYMLNRLRMAARTQSFGTHLSPPTLRSTQNEGAEE